MAEGCIADCLSVGRWDKEAPLTFYRKGINMLKYFEQYESLSEAHMKTFRLLLWVNLCLLKMLLIYVKLALLS